MSRQIIPGIELDNAGRASVDASMGRRLISLAIELESFTSRPVDVQHVLAAIIMAAASGESVTGELLQKPEPRLMRLLASHVEQVFQRTGGHVSEDD